jgi:hypothetical protein
MCMIVVLTLYEQWEPGSAQDQICLYVEIVHVNVSVDSLADGNDGDVAVGK